MFTQPLTDEDIDRLEGIIKSGDPIRAATAAVELMVEVKRLRADRDEAVAHRDDYETRCIEQSIEIRTLRAELLRLRLTDHSPRLT